MAAVPRSLLTFGASLLTARAKERLRRTADGHAAQRGAFAGLVPRLALCPAWKSSGIEAGMSHGAFQERVPLQTYEDFAPRIERMSRGEADVLWPGRCRYFAVTSGTASAGEKFIPVTDAMLDHFRNAALESLLWYTARACSSRVFRGRHLLLGGSTELRCISDPGAPEAWSGDLTGIAMTRFPKWMNDNFYEPGAEIARMADWPAKVAAIARRTARADISLLAGMPSWALILAEALRANGATGGRPAANLQEIWPHLECFVHGGIPIAPFQDELRAALGPTVRFHEVYPACEAFIAAQDAEAAAGLRLIVDAGVFFEFIPIDDFDEANLAALGARAVPLSGVKEGADYALVLTSPAGLARYVVGDVVRFISTRPPRIAHVGRTQLRLGEFDENVVEKEITDALVTVCRRNEWTIVNFHVAPMLVQSTTGRKHGRHEWWVELKPGTNLTPTGPIMAVELDLELRRLNPAYESRRRAGIMEAPFVRLVMPGVFERWMRDHGKWGGQNKMPRCRNDRAIADELGKATHFAND